MGNLSQWSSKPRRVVAICGGAVSGSEAAALCAEADISALVFEQGKRPYGKIEDGLPRWHDRLREREYARIDESLSRPGVVYVPNTVLGRDVTIGELSELGIPYLLLANGAYRDRPLPLPDAERFVGRGLIYQNPFVHWFNHSDEPNYDGPKFDIQEGMIVVGGGLASIDVAKIINLELYCRALASRGIERSIVELEHAGIGPTLADLGIDPKSLGIAPARIYYRRRVADMPVAAARGADADAISKAERTREKLMSVLRDKFLVEVEPCHIPVGLIEEDGRLVGLRFRRSEVQGGKLVEVAGSDYDVRAPAVVCSIGSVPAPITSVPMRGELYDFEDYETGRLRGLPGVYGLGNVLTGKGNIRDSRENAQQIASQIIGSYAGGSHTDDARAHIREQARALTEAAKTSEPLSLEQLASIAKLVERRWQAAGYDGDYRAFVAR